MSSTPIGKYIDIDSEVCGGAPVFRGTGVRVTEVLEEIARGLPRDVIIERRQGRISRDAISEAVRLAGELLAKHHRVPPKQELDAPPTILGEYIVADPAICHGAVTFRGTRIFVDAVLDDVADDEPWDNIIENWHNSVSQQSIAEAIRLAASSLVNHASDPLPEPAPA
jgi:uncharacterized protein (DUF433 family)